MLSLICINSFLFYWLHFTLIQDSEATLSVTFCFDIRTYFLLASLQNNFKKMPVRIVLFFVCFVWFLISVSFVLWKLLSFAETARTIGLQTDSLARWQKRMNLWLIPKWISQLAFIAHNCRFTTKLIQLMHLQADCWHNVGVINARWLNRRRQQQ